MFFLDNCNNRTSNQIVYIFRNNGDSNLWFFRLFIVLSDFPLSVHRILQNVYIVGYEASLNSDGQTCNSRAVIPPWSPGLRIEGVTVRNFNGPNCTGILGTVITCLCSVLCGGYEYRMK